MPGGDLGRLLDQLVERFLADLRALVGEQGGDRGLVVGPDDRVGHRAHQAFPPRDGLQLSSDAAVVDDVEQVLLGEERRKLEDGAGNDLLHVTRQALNDRGRRVHHILERVGHYPAHQRGLITRQDLQGFENVALRPSLFVLRELRGQSGDLGGQLAPHGFVVVAGQDQGRLGRGPIVGGQAPAHFHRFVLGQIIEDLRFDVVAVRQPGAHLRIVVLKQPLGLLVGKRGLVVVGPSYGLVHPSPFALSPAAILMSAFPFRFTSYMAASARAMRDRTSSGLSGS